MILLVIALIKVDASEGDYRRETARTPMNQKDRPMTAMTNRRPTAPNEQALSAFLTAKVEIDAMLERLKTHSDNHFDTHPDEVNWGHVGNRLRQMGGQPCRLIPPSAIRSNRMPSPPHGRPNAPLPATMPSPCCAR